MPRLPVSTPRQARYWLVTAAHHLFVPYLPPGIVWTRGQLEFAEGGFLHWQFCIGASKKVSLATLRGLYGPLHFEPTRSDAATAYCWKDDTAVAGTRFEIGVLAMQRNSANDWERIW